MVNGTRVIGVQDWKYVGRVGTVVDGDVGGVVVAFDDGVIEYVRRSVLVAHAK